jgi:charged multivesicular body protein 4A/B
LQELAELEQETLDERLSGADTVPISQPVKTKSFTVTEEEDEEEQLRQLQASLAM